LFFVYHHQVTKKNDVLFCPEEEEEGEKDCRSDCD